MLPLMIIMIIIMVTMMMVKSFTIYRYIGIPLSLSTCLPSFLHLLFNAMLQRDAAL
jgi:hypothetical protein